MEACPRVSDDLLAVVGYALHLQGKYLLLHLVILGPQLLESGEQRLEVLGSERIRGGFG